MFPSRKAAETNLPPTGAFVFTTAAGLQSYLEKFPVAAAVEIWNGLTGAAPVTKFKDRATAVSRIWRAIQSLAQAEATLVAEPKRPGPKLPCTNRLSRKHPLPSPVPLPTRPLRHRRPTLRRKRLPRKPR